MEYPFELRKASCVVCGGEVDEPVDLLGALEAGPELIAAALRVSAGAKREGWSPEFVAAHLADLEVYRGMRIRRTIAEDEPRITGIDQELWAEKLGYGRRDLDAAMASFAANRRENVALLRMAGEAAMERGYNHNDLGRVTLRGLVKHTTHHDRGHLRQILGE
jgi:hypothetical protein